MVSPEAKRAAVAQMRQVHGASERRACGLIDQPRSSQRYHPQRREGEAELIKRMLELVKKHPRYGYRFVWALLRAEGFKINRKRVYRLWRREGLKVPVKRHKKRRLGTSGGSAVLQERGCDRCAEGVVPDPRDAGAHSL